MIRHKIMDLRTDWATINRYELGYRLRGDEIQVIPWQRHYDGGSPTRSYVILSESGGIFLVVFRRVP